jgi:hypothetical protein
MLVESTLDNAVYLRAGKLVVILEAVMLITRCYLVI